MPIRVKLKLADVRALAAVDQYIRRFDIKWPDIRQSFSDMHDGGLFEIELETLLKRHLVRWVPERPRREAEAFRLIGNYGRTVDLTLKALKLFWPERVPKEL